MYLWFPKAIVGCILVLILLLFMIFNFTPISNYISIDKCVCKWLYALFMYMFKCACIMWVLFVCLCACVYGVCVCVWVCVCVCVCVCRHPLITLSRLPTQIPSLSEKEKPLAEMCCLLKSIANIPLSPRHRKREKPKWKPALCVVFPYN